MKPHLGWPVVETISANPYLGWPVVETIPEIPHMCWSVVEAIPAKPHLGSTVVETIPEIPQSVLICSMHSVKHVTMWDLTQYDVIIFHWQSCDFTHGLSLMNNQAETVKLLFFETGSQVSASVAGNIFTSETSVFAM